MHHYISVAADWMIGIGFSGLTLYFGCIWWFAWQRLRWLRSSQLVSLEFIPPADIERSAQATEHLIRTLAALRSYGRRRDRWRGRVPFVTLEIASSHHAGISYRCRVDRRYRVLIERAIRAYLPEVVIEELNELPFQPTTTTAFRQTGHYAFPLRGSYQATSPDHDPFHYLLNAMGHLKSGEQIGLQLVVEPVQLKKASRLARQILANDAVLHRLSQQRQTLIVKVLQAFVFGALDVMSEFFFRLVSGSKSSQQNSALVSQYKHPNHALTARHTIFDQQLVGSITNKLTQPLFRVSLRVAYKMPTPSAVAERQSAVTAALTGYSLPLYQALVPQRLHVWQRRRLAGLYSAGLPAQRGHQCLLLSASELASLYHFPHVAAGRPEHVVTRLSHALPPPLAVKQSLPFAMPLGENHYHGRRTPLGLTTLERGRHVYLVGGTGTGKTTLLIAAIIQDMARGNGLAVIDPHGDMAEKILACVPAARVSDVIYFNPDDLDFPLAVNLLELPTGLSGNDLLREKDLVTESVVSLFRKLFSDDGGGGHRIEYILRNAVQTALTLEKATLFTVFKLLQDQKYRRRVVSSLYDQDLRDFWQQEFGKAGDMQRVKIAAGITAKIGRYLFAASAKQVFGQPVSTVNFDAIIAEGKILICRFPKGLLGEDTSALFGITVLAKLQLAALRRAEQPENDRRPFYVYVDEFQNFATPSFVQLLSEARKFGLSLIMAEQSTSQQADQKMINTIFANVGTVICFRSGSPADEKILLPLFTPYVGAGGINNLPPYHFYARFSATHSQEPTSGCTQISLMPPNESIASAVIQASRTRYALPLMPNKVPEQPTASAPLRSAKAVPGGRG